jgi:hypothetical protein
MHDRFDTYFCCCHTTTTTAAATTTTTATIDHHFTSAMHFTAWIRNEKEWKSHGEKETNNSSHLEDSHHTKAYLPAYAASEHYARFLTPDFAFRLFLSFFRDANVLPPRLGGWVAYLGAVGFGWRKETGMGMGGRETGHGWVWMDSLTINPGDGGLWVLRKGHGAGFLCFLLFLFFFFQFLVLLFSGSGSGLPSCCNPLLTRRERDSGIGDRKRHRETLGLGSS